MNEQYRIKKIGFLDKGTGEHQSNIIYDKDGISPGVLAGFGVKQQVTMIVVKVVRNND
jgi:hypothetical protein